jgi:DNA repair protein RecN (Recombination protein N)
MATDGMYDGEDSIYNRLSGFRSMLRKAAGRDEGISQHLSTLEEIASSLQEVSREFQSILDDLDADPEALAQAELRLDTYNRLKMKFSATTIESLMEMREDFRQKLNEIGSLEGELLDLQKELDKAEKETVSVGLELEKLRAAAIPTLDEAVNQLLLDVGFQGAAFRAVMTRNESPEGAFLMDGKRVAGNPDGFNRLEFRIRTNKGVPEGNLSQTASGGEISRVMLAIKAALAGRADLAVLIFDEIDTGISGETARKVGQVMQKLGKSYQIIAITHLPQIAGMGGQHFHIYKQDEAEQTVSRIRELSAQERVEELARMISGASLTESALANARELLKDQQR